MVSTVVKNIFFPIFRQCAFWISQIFSAVGGWGIYLAAFLLICIVGLFLVPLRGAALGSIQGFTVSKIHKR